MVEQGSSWIDLLTDKLLVMNEVCGGLSEIERERRDLLIAQVFMTRHVATWNPEFSDARELRTTVSARLQVPERSGQEVGGLVVKLRLVLQASWAVGVVAGGALVLVKPLSFGRIGVNGVGKRGLPGLLGSALSLRVPTVKTCKVGHKIVTALIAKEECERRHDGAAADFVRLDEVSFEPQRGTAPAHLRQIGALTPIADQRRLLR